MLQHAGNLARRLIALLGGAACLVALAVSPAQAQRIAITIDDLPYVLPSRTTPAEGLRIVKAVNAALAKQGAPATGFAVGRQITPESRPALEAFAQAGHGIGNHSWSHPDYGTLSPRGFRRETHKTHRALAKWRTQPLYYSFPFLREGETEYAKAAADRILSNLGYRNVPVSIDNDEWQFNADYMDALDAGDQALANQIAVAYIAHMQERTAHFQALAAEALGRDVAHILLLHMNRINADHLHTLLAWYAAEGWDFISVQEALQDPLYSAPDLYAGPRGLSQIERIMEPANE